MGVWEHAFVLDYAPADCPRYIEAFPANIDREVLDRGLSAASVHVERARAAV